MKRVFLFLITNLAVMLVLGVVTSMLGVNAQHQHYGEIGYQEQKDTFH